MLSGLHLNDRQRQAIAHVKIEGRIGNLEYQRLTGAIKKTATRDLDELVARGLLIEVGTTGRGVHYVRARKGDIKGTKGTSAATTDKGDKRANARCPDESCQKCTKRVIRQHNKEQEEGEEAQHHGQRQHPQQKEGDQEDLEEEQEKVTTDLRLHEGL